MPLYSDSEALDTIIKYLAILIPDIFALGRKWTRKWPVALCNSTKVQFLGNPLTLGINADKSINFEAEQIISFVLGCTQNQWREADVSSLCAIRGNEDG